LESYRGGWLDLRIVQILSPDGKHMLDRQKSGNQYVSAMRCLTLACLAVLIALILGMAVLTRSRTHREPAASPKTGETSENTASISGTSAPEVKTPVGRYEKAVFDAIRLKWIYYVGQNRDSLTPGTIAITFYITPDGHVEDLKVISNSANEILAQASIKAINSTKFPPIPSDIPPNTLDKGRYEEKISFTIYPYDSDASPTPQQKK
jgi:TonB family protein